MSQHSYPPPRLRYLKARLSIFQKPAFWGSCFFLLVASIIGWQYAFNPNFLGQEKNSELKPTVLVNEPEMEVSSEDQGIAADIDNLPVLLNDVQRAAFSGRVVILKQDSDEKENKDFLKGIIKDSNEDKKAENSSIDNQSQAENISNQFILVSENLLNFSNENGKAQFLGVNDVSEFGNPSVNINSANTELELKNNTYQIPNSTLVTSEKTSTVKSSSLISGMTANKETTVKSSSLISGITANKETTNSLSSSLGSISGSKSNLPNQSLIPGNTSYIQPVIQTQQANVSPNVGGLVPNNSLSPVNMGMPNNTGVSNSNTIEGSGSYSGYGITPSNKSQSSNLPNTGY